MAFSPTLADKVALDTTRLSIEAIALRVIEIVRPDIITTLKKRASFLEALQKATPQRIPINKIVRSPIRHAVLSKSLLPRSHLVSKVLQDVSPLSLEMLIDSLRRDVYPQDSIEDWEALAIAYLNLTQNRELNMEQKKEVFQALLFATSGSLTEEDFSGYHYVTPEMIKEAFRNVVPEINDEENEQSTLDE